MNYLIRSLVLDLKLLSINLAFWDKLELIVEKYITLFRNFLFGFTPGESFVTLFGQKYYFDDVFGIAYLQSVYVDNWFLKKFIPKSAIILDVGANIGQSNFFYRHYLHTRNIYSFEPSKKTFAILKKNVQKNIYNYAISTNKSIKLFTPSLSLMSSQYKYTDDDIVETAHGVTLDSIVHELGLDKIDLLKIDTEGSEFDVLLASKTTLKKTKYLLIEASVSRKSSKGILEVVSFLKKVLDSIELVHIGRVFEEQEKTVAVDLFFRNNSFRE